MTESTVFVPVHALAVLSAKAAQRAKDTHFDIGPNSISECLASVSKAYQNAIVDVVADEKKDAHV